MGSTEAGLDGLDRPDRYDPVPSRILPTTRVGLSQRMRFT